MWFERPIEFWLGILAAILVKVRTSERLTLWGAIFTFIGSLAAAVAFSEPVSAVLGLPMELAGAFTALVADQFMRALTRLFEDPDYVKSLIVSWLTRGKGPRDGNL